MRATQTIKRLWPVLLLSTLAACGGSSTTNPVTGGGTDAGNGGTDSEAPDDNGGFNAGVTPPPGTANPTPQSSILRTEPAGNTGDGFVTQVSYDAGADTFTVDNLAFDGVGAYDRDDQVPGNNAIFPYAVYEGDPQTTDPRTGNTIDQYQHKAIYAVSASGQSKFAIVRTGGYIDYGFGGFLYQRDGGVTLPTSGQAQFTGDYMGLRDFEGRGGLEYTVADMVIDVDFDDFNDGSAIKGGLSNRRVYDTAGNDITQDVVDAINAEKSTTLSQLPVLRIDVRTGAVTANGESTGTLQSVISTADGLEQLETGNYYAVLSGTNADEVVGVLAITSEDLRFEGVTVRETGGFILTR